MTPTLTIHCDCGTDIQATPTDRSVTCPDCAAAFALQLLLRQASTDAPNRHPTAGSTHQFRLAKALHPLSIEDDAPHTRYGTRTYRGP